LAGSAGGRNVTTDGAHVSVRVWIEMDGRRGV